MKLQIHPKAVAEYEAAATYYESCEEGLGAEFSNEVEEHLATMLETPGVWPLWPNTPPKLGMRRFRLHRFPYAIAYRVEGDTLRVYSVAAYKRTPGYWLSRVD